jgi:NADH pyrophosphatase NudC (nudix superfamily)
VVETGLFLVVAALTLGMASLMKALMKPWKGAVIIFPKTMKESGDVEIKTTKRRHLYGWQILCGKSELQIVSRGVLMVEVSVKQVFCCGECGNETYFQNTERGTFLGFHCGGCGLHFWSPGTSLLSPVKTGQDGVAPLPQTGYM